MRINFITEGLPLKITVNNWSIQKKTTGTTFPSYKKRTGTAFPCVPVRLKPCHRIKLFIVYNFSSRHNQACRIQQILQLQCEFQLSLLNMSLRMARTGVCCRFTSLTVLSGVTHAVVADLYHVMSITLFSLPVTSYLIFYKLQILNLLVQHYLYFLPEVQTFLYCFTHTPTPTHTFVH